MFAIPIAQSNHLFSLQNVPYLCKFFYVPFHLRTNTRMVCIRQMTKHLPYPLPYEQSKMFVVYLYHFYLN